MELFSGERLGFFINKGHGPHRQKAGLGKSHREVPKNLGGGQANAFPYVAPTRNGTMKLNKKPEAMGKTDDGQKDKGTGADFINQQRAVDEAINERLKSEAGKDKIDPRRANDVEHKPDHSQKKTGRTKH